MDDNQDRNVLVTVNLHSGTIDTLCPGVILGFRQHSVASMYIYL